MPISSSNNTGLPYFQNNTHLDDLNRVVTDHSNGSDNDDVIDEDYQEEMSLVIVSVLIGLIIMLCLLLVVLLFPPIWHFIRRKIPVSPAKIKRRYQTIDAWLITKRVLKKCEKCSKTIQYNHFHQNQDSHHHYHSSNGNSSCSSTSSAKETQYQSDTTTILTTQVTAQNLVDAECSSQSDDMVTVEGNECLICMELFKIGDKISWSANEACEHAFHHSCIREWLLRHTDCPCCRRLFLPVDCRSRAKLSNDLLKEMSSERSRRRRKTAFCIEHGLVVLLSSPTSSGNNINNSSGSTRNIISSDGDGDRSNEEISVSPDTPKSVETVETMQTVESLQSSQDNFIIENSDELSKKAVDIETASRDNYCPDNNTGADEGPVSIWSWH